jgi:mutator protein MutT
MSKKQIVIVVAVIRNEAGDVLLAQRHQPEIPEIHGKWEFVGGGVDFGENPTNALIRECKEEIGVDVEVIRILPQVTSDIQKFDNGDELHVLALPYECKIISGNPKSTDVEIGEVKFFKLGEISKLDAFENIYRTIKLL